MKKNKMRCTFNSNKSLEELTRAGFTQIEGFPTMYVKKEEDKVMVYCEREESREDKELGLVGIVPKLYERVYYGKAGFILDFLEGL